jgi:hypothetical protein
MTLPSVKSNFREKEISNGKQRQKECEETQTAEGQEGKEEIGNFDG